MVNSITTSFINIPTWVNGIWQNTSFNTKVEFRDFLLPLFKEPGKYEFNETSYEFNREGRKYNSLGFYCPFPEGTLDFKHYWDFEKEKCRFGVLYIDGDKKWYLPREYYMWLNFLPINDKVARKFTFPAIWDSQYHMALYETLAELHEKHAAILKKRQFGSSYFHCAKLINQIWFEESVVLKIGASLKKYINEEGSWKFLDEYRSFLNTNTAWYRPFSPGKVGMWRQQIDTTSSEGRESKKGLKGTLQLTSFEKDATSGVGGGIRYFFHEEAGIAPKMKETIGYLFPALRLGEHISGMFIAAGTVGDLAQCEPLKDLILKADDQEIYAVETDLLDDTGIRARTGLFIPEQWSRPPYMDEFGNSKVEEALASLNEEMERWKKNLEPEEYRLRMSQHPRNIAEAFAWRNESKFPMHLVKSQQLKIKDKDYSTTYIELFKGTDKIEYKRTEKLPISEFPIKKDAIDKSGSIVVWEFPDPDATFGTYYASVDPVAEGKTISSESLCSIYVYKNPVEVTRINQNETETFLEGDKIVAAWCGRFDDINKTHERLELLIEWYNAWTVVENNIPSFITHMINKRKQKYLVPKNQMLWLKDIGANASVFQEYGWRNTGAMFKTHLLSYLIDYLKEEIDHVTKPDGTIVKTIYGITRIPDIMAMEEMIQYTDGLNVDRLVALAALIAFAKVQQANRGLKKRTEVVNKQHLQKTEDLYKLNISPFRNIGQTKQRRNPFKHLK